MNNEKNIFEVATRKSFRFPFKGLVSVEDLWDLSTKDLDSIFKTLKLELKQFNEESLLNTKTQQDQELDMKIEIIKHIVKIKLDEEESRVNAKKKKEERQEILELITLKKNEAKRSMTIEELEKMADELDN